MLRYSVILPWLAGLLLQGILLGILLAKRMWKRFPVFLFYSASNFILGAVLFCILLTRPSRAVWYGAYWITEGIGLLLGLGVVYEIFKHLIRPYPGLRKLASVIFRVAIITLVVAGCLLATSQASGQDQQLTRKFL